MSQKLALSQVYRYLALELDGQGAVTLWLNRTQVHNAFDDHVIAELIDALNTIAAHPEIRLCILRAKGKHFSAGADLNWMQRSANQTKDQNINDAKQLAQLMQTLNELNKPTIAVVQGHAYGGAIGLISCCDIALALTQTQFCFSEVRIGLIPAVISPYVLRAIGERNARRYFLSAEPFNAEQAKMIGLIHELAADEQQLTEQLESLTQTLLANGPEAMHQAKQIIQQVSHRTIDPELINQTIQAIANIRVGSEGQEGLIAFLDKRPPNWHKHADNSPITPVNPSDTFSGKTDNK